MSIRFTVCFDSKVTAPPRIPYIEDLSFGRSLTVDEIKNWLANDFLTYVKYHKHIFKINQKTNVDCFW